MERITSRQNPLVQQIRKLNNSRSHRRTEGLFVGEGPKLLAEALGAGMDIGVVVAAEGVRPDCPPAIRQVEVPEDLLKSLSTTETPQGVLFLCRMPDLTPPDKLTGGRYLVLDGLQDPGNLGTIWRTADAFGADGLLLVNSCADPFSPKTVRATMGAAFRLPAWECGLGEAKALLDAAGIPLYATALRDDTLDVREAELSRATVVIGSEGRGISREALALCAGTVKIPMRERCESLNAAVAAGVVLWEMKRSEM